jgi:hypothetical protein
LLLFLHAPIGENPRRIWDIALALFFISFFLYGTYALYFCQTTMLHGDEGQYLRVTQSLLHDGDMDLANNIDNEQILEFHVRDFAVNKAASSPPGKVFSVHPIGLSALTVPAYWLGLTWWQNPRLSTALFMVLLAAACVALTFVWLVRLAIPRFPALLSTAIMALSAPLFFYSNQIYPEVPALLITLIGLTALSHWQVSGGAYKQLGRFELPLLLVLTVLLAFLPFLHPRYLTIVVVIQTLILLQAWHSPQRRFALAAIGTGAVISLGALIAFNYSFSGDWMGNFRPGNTWPEDVIAVSAWGRSLPGQWLFRQMGLLNNAPVFLLVFAGWALLASKRDRRFLIAAALFGATALVNGLNNIDWTMGFCLPARFFVVALPPLILGLAYALAALQRSALGLFLAFGAFAIGIDGIATALTRSEMAYHGKHLILRTVNLFYPFDIHFSPEPSAPEFGDALFWFVSIDLSILVFFPNYHRFLRPATIALAALLPFLWSKSDLLAARFLPYSSPYLSWVENNGDVHLPNPLGVEFTNRLRQTTGEIIADEFSQASAPQHGPGFLAVHRIPIHLTPGWYQLKLPDLKFSHPPEQIAGHIVASSLHTVVAVSDWARTFSMPIYADAETQLAPLSFFIDWTSSGYVYVEFSGVGQLQYKTCHLTFYPTIENRHSELLHKFDREPATDEQKPISTALIVRDLSPGHYRAHFDFSGSAFATLLQRKSAPVSTAIYPAHGQTEHSSQMRDQVKTWLTQALYSDRLSLIRPQVENHQAAWWLNIPLVGSSAYDLRFSLDMTQDVWCLARYAGPQHLQLEKITIYRETFTEETLP